MNARIKAQKHTHTLALAQVALVAANRAVHRTVWIQPDGVATRMLPNSNTIVIFSKCRVHELRRLPLLVFPPTLVEEQHSRAGQVPASDLLARTAAEIVPSANTPAVIAKKSVNHDVLVTRRCKPSHRSK